MKRASERLSGTGIDPLIVELLLSERAPDSLTVLHDEYELLDVVQHIYTCRLQSEYHKAQQDK